jgi:hypothetical protein
MVRHALYKQKVFLTTKLKEKIKAKESIFTTKKARINNEEF